MSSYAIIRSRFKLWKWRLFNRQKYANDQKIFCVGRNKTGTTSIGKFLSEAGIKVGKQRPAELMVRDLINMNYSNLEKFVRYHGVAFQDVPFSWPNIYKILDRMFPNSKFILTVRDSSDQWYNSVVNFNSKIFASGRLPLQGDLKNSTYVYKGWAWEANKYLYGDRPSSEIYDKKTLVTSYELHNKEVQEHFADRPQQLLVVNLSDKNASDQIKRFLGIEDSRLTIPWENKTENVKIR